MSSVEEKKFLKLLKFSVEIATMVVRSFIKSNILINFEKSFKQFLDLHKHSIFHLWSNSTKCCECSVFLRKGDRDLQEEQLKKLYILGTDTTHGHSIVIGNTVKQYCICDVKVNEQCSLDKLDTALTYTLMSHCVSLSPSEEMWLTTVKDIVGNLNDAECSSYFDQGTLDKWWKMLERSVLGLASKVPPTFFEESVKTSIDLLKTSDIDISNVEEKRVNIKAVNGKSCSIRKQYDRICANIISITSLHQRDVADEEANENVQQAKGEYNKMEEEEEHLIEEQQKKKARFDVDEDDNIRGPECQEGRSEKEVDENAVCAVCKDIRPEENNDMIGCDGCNLYVHQACYGVEDIPEGNWFCKTCEAGIKPKCALCLQSGGAMKITSDGSQWAHVSCVWWIPGVKFGNPKEMASIEGIDKIPEDRWSLICSICHVKDGACIQCSVKNCTKSFHVICAYSSGLRMDASCSEDKPDPVFQVQNKMTNFKAYCKSHGNHIKTLKKKHKGHFDASKRQKSDSRNKSIKQAATKKIETKDTLGVT